jgi:glycosyltransferase involved in cell wall biosynthesis
LAKSFCKDDALIHMSINSSSTRNSGSLPTERAISIVLPCYNEVAAIRPVLDRLKAMADAWTSEGFHLFEVIVVDDGSTDGTHEAAAQWTADNLHNSKIALSIVTHKSRRGYGGALKTGIATAGGDFIAFYDVDGTYDPALIPSMIQSMISRKASMACGDRLSMVEHMPLTREVGNRLFVGTINLLYRTRVFDSCTGMRVFSRDLRDFFSSSALPNGLDYSLAMTLTFLRTGHSLIEMPIPYSKRIGRSKLRVLTDGPRFFLRILASWMHTPDHVKAFRHSRKTE